MPSVLVGSRPRWMWPTRPAVATATPTSSGAYPWPALQRPMISPGRLGFLPTLMKALSSMAKP